MPEKGARVAKDLGVVTSKMADRYDKKAHRMPWSFDILAGKRGKGRIGLWHRPRKRGVRAPEEDATAPKRFAVLAGKRRDRRVGVCRLSRRKGGSMRGEGRTDAGALCRPCRKKTRRSQRRLSAFPENSCTGAKERGVDAERISIAAEPACKSRSSFAASS